jgi:hypothetical protein
MLITKDFTLEKTQAKWDIQHVMKGKTHKMSRNGITNGPMKGLATRLIKRVSWKTHHSLSLKLGLLP